MGLNTVGSGTGIINMPVDIKEQDISEISFAFGYKHPSSSRIAQSYIALLNEDNIDIIKLGIVGVGTSYLTDCKATLVYNGLNLSLTAWRANVPVTTNGIIADGEGEVFITRQDSIWNLHGRDISHLRNFKGCVVPCAEPERIKKIRVEVAGTYECGIKSLTIT